VSKLGDQARCRTQPAADQELGGARGQQTAALRGFVDQILKVDPKANVVISRDFTNAVSASMPL